MIRILPRTTLAIVLWLLLLTAGGELRAQQSSDSTARSLRSLLNPDGTINLTTGFNGSLDACGWNLVSDPDGAPRFVRSEKDETDLAELTYGDDGWDDRFGPPGTSGTVYAVAVSGDDVYIGGRFVTAGSLLASNIARWNAAAKQWSVLGTDRVNGTGGVVYSLAIDGDDLYVGGVFPTAGGVDAPGIARWNKTENEWYSLGRGMERATPCNVATALRSGDVLTILIDGDNIYAGGAFTAPDANLAVWSKSRQEWTALGVPNGSVRSIVRLHNGTIFIAGHFDTIGGIEANHIVRYNPVNGTWAPLGAGTDSTVNTLATIGTDLYAGGTFLTAGGAPARRLAKWDGNAWTQVGGGVDAPVWNLTASGTDLWVGGEFTVAGSFGANGIAKWNGAAWSVLDIGIGVSINAATKYEPGNNYGDCTKQDIEVRTLRSPHVAAIGVVGGTVIAGGHFSTAGSFTAHNVAAWDGAAWAALARPELNNGNQNGVNGAVFAVAISGDDVYLGGDFTRAGNIEARYVARWNTRTSTWSALGTGIGGSSPFVRVIAVSGANVYVGGSFTSAGGITANNIAMWNGSTWSALGSGAGGETPYVFAILPRGSDLYVGGAFTAAGGVPANRVARWSGGVWSALGAGVAGAGAEYAYVTSLAIDGDKLYAGGEFQRAGGGNASRIAVWNGTDWSAVGGGVNATVSTIAVAGGTIYIGGDFTTAGGAPASRLARWNGTAWSGLGRGASGAVRTLTVGPSGEIYAGGEFTRIDSVLPALRIAKWDGSAWSILGPDTAAGTNGPVHAIGVGGGMVYAGGAFSVAGGFASNNIGVWDGRSWSSLGSNPVAGLYGIVLALAVRGNEAYVGGLFPAVGGMKANGIAKWDGEKWSRLGAGVDGIVRAIALASSGDVYVGGEFSRAGEAPAAGVAMWNGNTWSALGAGVGGNNPYVYALVLSGSDLYVGGAFSTAGGQPAYRIARWNTTSRSWSSLGDGIGGSSYYTYVASLATAPNGVYAGGIFPIAGTGVVNNIAHWDGTRWVSLGGGVNGGVYAITGDASGNVYVGGEFSTAGDVSAANIAHWNGTGWSRMAGGANGPVYALHIAEGEVYAGGGFTFAGDEFVRHIAAWNGAKWFALGSGVAKDMAEGNVVALASVGKRIYVGGDFTVAGGRPSYYFGIWDRTSVSVPDERPVPAAADAALLASNPNPASSETTVSFRLDREERVDLTLCDLRGGAVRLIHEGVLAAGEHDLRVDVRDLPQGVYICRLRAGARVITHGLVIQK